MIKITREDVNSLKNVKDIKRKVKKLKTLSDKIENIKIFFNNFFYDIELLKDLIDCIDTSSADISFYGILTTIEFFHGIDTKEDMEYHNEFLIFIFEKGIDIDYYLKNYLSKAYLSLEILDNEKYLKTSNDIKQYLNENYKKFLECKNFSLFDPKLFKEEDFLTIDHNDFFESTYNLDDPYYLSDIYPKLTINCNLHEAWLGETKYIDTPYFYNIYSRVYILNIKNKMLNLPILEKLQLIGTPSEHNRLKNLLPELKS